MKNGQKYVVNVSGCRLTRMTSVAPYTYIPESRELEAGAVIEFLGDYNCFGSDPIPVPFFKTDDGKFQGEFWPNHWGYVSEEVLSEFVRY